MHYWFSGASLIISSIFEKVADMIFSTEPQSPDIGRLFALSSNPHLPQLGGRP